MSERPSSRWKAVFVGLLVGISTKQIRVHTHPLVKAIGRVLWHHENEPIGRTTSDDHGVW